MSSPVVVVDAAELAVLVRDAVRGALEAQRADAPAVLDRAGLARALGCSLASVDRLLREGCPCVRLGSDPRFVVANVVAWLQAREQKV